MNPTQWVPRSEVVKPALEERSLTGRRGGWAHCIGVVERKPKRNHNRARKSELVLEMDAVSSLVLCWSIRGCVYVCLVSVGVFVWLRVGHWIMTTCSGMKRAVPVLCRGSEVWLRGGIGGGWVGWALSFLTPYHWEKGMIKCVEVNWNQWRNACVQLL